MIILNKYRVTNMNRFKAFIFTSVLIISFIIFLLLSSLTKAYSTNNIIYDTVYVEKGDTIWQIASKYNCKLSMDEFIYNIREANNLSDCTIYPGQELLIPID
ncbi:LysM peptidoglycan-binding domain-containing protein [Sedimentibacter sp. zth1]|uniref:cell division suppressor protein YneA n=1 Tax=Sedimentibacter sp. zth1 TaxID=2816908 RepID=UPI001A925DAF|nr:LysM peptidoglycan-binding domain-containing protein [Sedimentibacter sp. zth1]QSX06514.1 LysM peptidoglycan-binding domain-containing protein [Sedimentibacter sp. zth1]